MKRDIKLNNYEISARACKIETDNVKTIKGGNYEIDVSIITAVDLKNSKALQMASGDFGIVIYNELNFGFVISWKIFEEVQAALNIQEANYEDFLDKVCDNFSDTILGYISGK